MGNPGAKRTAVAGCECCGRTKAFLVPADAEVGSRLEPPCNQYACRSCGGRCRGDFVVTRLDGD